MAAALVTHATNVDVVEGICALAKNLSVQDAHKVATVRAGMVPLLAAAITAHTVSHAGLVAAAVGALGCIATRNTSHRQLIDASASVQVALRTAAAQHPASTPAGKFVGEVFLPFYP